MIKYDKYYDKYVLLIIDIASRYKDASPLTSKDSGEVSNAFKKFYSRRLDWPKILLVEPGKEFMGKVTHLMENHGVKIQRSETGHHRAQGFVERANRTLGEKIFSHQYEQEMVMKEGRSREWVKRLSLLIQKMNNNQTQIIGKEPSEAIELKNVEFNDKNYKTCWFQ